MQDAFDWALDFVLEWEKRVYTNNPKDPGGETKFGISKRAYPHLNIKELTFDDAKAIYRRDFWDQLRCDQMPAPIAIAVFDSGVNQGQPAAAVMLQNALHDYHRSRIVADGIIGPHTLQAVREADLGSLLSDFIAYRSVRYAHNKKLDDFGMGWFRRVSSCHQVALAHV